MVRTVRLSVASVAAVCAACALWACARDSSPSCEVPAGLSPQQLPPGFCSLSPQQLPPGETPSEDASARNDGSSGSYGGSSSSGSSGGSSSSGSSSGGSSSGAGSSGSGSSGGPAPSPDGGSEEASAAADASVDGFDVFSGDAPEDSTIDGEGGASFGEDGH